MILRSDIVEIGMFNKPHGVCGEVSATIMLTDFHVVEGMDCLIVNVDNIFVPFFISACRRKSAETYLFTIDGVENEREASMFNNKTIYVMRSAYDKLMQEFDDDELPIDYFVGFWLLNGNKKYMGDLRGKNKNEYRKENIRNKII